ncbi:phytanoyl-CoA dioxygenase family protein [Sphingobium sp. JS3065]|uniref:phytanoyl-CoA dioxygenase family protein n=1 Tax=Sphingobium sp. JS3065 TaxID=2970925 RepID=UPI002263D4E4|nr:phytanoyl-CoA dioxygenase family protein [Sphingobium sp. JS3065]UZW54605.1 phytanoyl-CoA dioxygenase family protein [Sphingobium sp. JS3065]
MNAFAPLLAPFWFAQLFTGAKSFIDNPLIGSPRLNARGLHAGRVRLAQAMTARRRRRLADAVDPADRAAFDRDGVVEIRDFLPAATFGALQQQLFAYRGPAREMVQGDTITRRLALDPAARRAIPAFEDFCRDPRWRALARYVSGFDIEPLLYVQSILPQRHDAPPDPQIAFHADTFYPAMKAWLFLEDVAVETGPFAYVKGSHRLTPQRLAWEKQRSLSARDGDCRLSARGSLRIDTSELAALDLPQPTIFAVPANTLLIADTFGFHARSPASVPATRVEIWAYGRRNPFRLAKGWDVWSLPGIAERRIPIRWWLGDRIAGPANQPWRPVGLKSAADG